MSESQTLHIAAAVITDQQQRLLLVRKKGSVYFMQPGGKIEPGEAPLAALLRELQEELNLVLAPDQLTPLGEFSDNAANEPDHWLVARLFRADNINLNLAPAAEIAELRWVTAEDLAAIPLAPLTANTVIPLLWAPAI